MKLGTAAWIAALGLVPLVAWAQDPDPPPPTPRMAQAAPSRLPPGWRASDDLLGEPPEVAKGDAVRLESRRGFGDPASGCYALEQRVTAPTGSVDGEAFRKVLTEELAEAGLTLEQRDGRLLLRGDAIEGAVSVKNETAAGDRDTVVSLACFYNQRDPSSCTAACQELERLLWSSP